MLIMKWWGKVNLPNSDDIFRSVAPFNDRMVEENFRFDYYNGK
jgi:hypothetical protein